MNIMRKVRLVGLALSVALPAQAVMSAVPVQAATVTCSPATPISLLPTLHLGDRGSCVTVAQLALSKQGIGVGPSGADGIYGPITLKATKSFQTAMRLVPDGIIGPLTWSKLRTASVPAPYNKDRGPNYTTRVILSYDDCPLSLTALKNMLLAAKASNTGLVLAPTGNCITAFKSRYGVDIVPLIRSYGQYAINHSVSHGRF